MLRELKLAVRLVLRQPAQRSLAVLVLALGIGLTTAMVSIVYGTFVPACR